MKYCDMSVERALAFGVDGQAEIIHTRCLMQKEQIAKMLKEYREKNHYTVKDVSCLLHERSIDVAPKTIYGWESGQASPRADMLLVLCRLYHISDVLYTFGYAKQNDFTLTNSEKSLVEAYRSHPDLQEAVRVLLGS